VAFVCGYTYFNDNIMRQTMFVGNFMPISVYGMLVILLLFIYPLFRKLNRRLLLKRGEIAVILAMTLASCAIPGSNLLRLFTPALIMPNHYEKVEPGWSQEKVLDLVPGGMIVDTQQDEETVLNGFIRGLSTGNESIPASEVPWQAWVKPVLFWMPIILSLWIAVIGLSLVVHRQWVDHEHLPYPIVTFTKSLLPQKDGSGSPVFHQRIFWLGLLAVLGIHLNNYLNMWFPDVMLGKIPLGVDFSSLADLFPTFVKGGGGGDFLQWTGTIYLTVVAVAYFLPTDVSFSLGIGPFVWIFLVGWMATYGIATTGWQSGWPFGITRESMIDIGAYTGMLFVLLYTGRHYYYNVFKRAVGFRSNEKLERSAVWGARVFMASMVVFVVYAALLAKLDWPLALLMGLFMIAFYLVMGRMLAETGLFFIVMVGTPATIIWAIFGSQSLGPQALLVMFMFCLVLFYDAREALMPYMINSLKLGDDCQVKVSRIASVAVVAILLGLAVGIPVTLYFQYDAGADITAWRTEQAKQPFNEVIGVMQRLEAQGQLETSMENTGVSRLASLSPHKQGLLFFGISLLLVIGFSALRLRFVKWPIHPVMFLVWNTYSGNRFYQSFLLGWLVKVLITKYGGANIYQKVKPLMFGVIAGEMLGGVLPMIVSLIYYLVTDGSIPKAFEVMPR
jgi:hypothetical protein